MARSKRSCGNVTHGRPGVHAFFMSVVQVCKPPFRLLPTKLADVHLVIADTHLSSFALQTLCFAHDTSFSSPSQTRDTSMKGSPIYRKQPFVRCHPPNQQCQYGGMSTCRTNKLSVSETASSVRRIRLALRSHLAAQLGRLVSFVPAKDSTSTNVWISPTHQTSTHARFPEVRQPTRSVHVSCDL